MDDLFDDTPPHKLSRTSDPQTSKDAAKTVSSGNDRAEMLEAIQQAGTKGLTLKEYCTKRGYQMSSKSSRCSELEESGYIFYQGDRCDRSRIIRAVEHDTGRRECGKCGGSLLSFYEMKCQSPKCKRD